jgi:hypothetical protein
MTIQAKCKRLEGDYNAPLRNDRQPKRVKEKVEVEYGMSLL